MGQHFRRALLLTGVCSSPGPLHPGGDVRVSRGSRTGAASKEAHALHLCGVRTGHMGSPCHLGVWFWCKARVEKVTGKSLERPWVGLPIPLLSQPAEPGRVLCSDRQLGLTASLHQARPGPWWGCVHRGRRTCSLLKDLKLGLPVTCPEWAPSPNPLASIGPFSEDLSRWGDLF